VELHLGSNGFFTTVFIKLGDRDRVFEGGPYFHALVGLYMQPWKENFSPEKETFKKVSVWLRLYSLPLDYWLPSTFEAIGNKLGKYISITKATLKGRYTSYTRICIDMDVSGALTEVVSVRKTGPRSNKIKQMQKQNTEDTQYKRDTDLCGSPSVGYVHQRNCQVLPLLLSSK
jgi:hypothetical protein